MNEEELREDLLLNCEKEQIIELFIKMKKAYQRVSMRLEKIENKYDELVDLDELIKSLPDKN